MEFDPRYASGTVAPYPVQSPGSLGRLCAVCPFAVWRDMDAWLVCLRRSRRFGASSSIHRSPGKTTGAVYRGSISVALRPATDRNHVSSEFAPLAVSELDAPREICFFGGSRDYVLGVCTIYVFASAKSPQPVEVLEPIHLHQLIRPLHGVSEHQCIWVSMGNPNDI